MHHLLLDILNNLTTYSLRRNHASISAYAELQAELRLELGSDGLLMLADAQHESQLDRHILDPAYSWESTFDIHPSMQLHVSAIPEVDMAYHETLKRIGCTLLNLTLNHPGSRRNILRKRSIERFLRSLPTCPVDLVKYFNEPRSDWDAYLSLPKYYCDAPALLIGARCWASFQGTDVFQ